uniref:RAD51D N-terminal domain-containing protein n=1 Tax=Anas platyrhynchos TaxID=8839 RepID=A0A8B9TPU2_ANAPL
MVVLRAGLCPGLTEEMIQVLRANGVRTVVDFVSSDLEDVSQKCSLSYKALVAGETSAAGPVLGLPCQRGRSLRGAQELHGHPAHREPQPGPAAGLGAVHGGGDRADGRTRAAGRRRCASASRPACPSASSSTSCSWTPRGGSLPPASTRCFRPRQRMRKSSWRLCSGSRWPACSTSMKC